MRLGTYEIPEVRLIPNAVVDTKKIYDTIQTGQIEAKEIGNVFNYKDHRTGVFYRRLNAMVTYGLLTQLSRSTYSVSELGIALAYPEPDKENIAKNKAVLNVKLWEEMFKKFAKNPPTDTFWIQLKNIAGIDPVEAKQIQSQIRKWYIDDISLLTLDSLGHPIGIDNDITMSTESKGLSSMEPQSNKMSQQMEVHRTSSLGQLTVPSMGTIEINDEDTLSIALSYLNVLKKKIQEKPKKEKASLADLSEEDVSIIEDGQQSD